MRQIHNTFVVGAYIRLSHEDDDKEDISESIKNQKSLILQYAKENNYKIEKIYIDDGYSGTNFERPQFKKMITDIENKTINMIITKDMSRLGRDYIGTGNLIEKYFPEHNVRYIAITDNIDTFLDSSNNDIAPFKAIMNDMYAKDISKKIRASLKAKMKEGKYISGRSPFGYSIDPNNKNHLVINNGQAAIVKRIYNMCLEGKTYSQIAKKLTEEHIKTPSQYYSFTWKNNNYGVWNNKTIRDILTNQVYIGNLVQNKRNKVNYKIKKVTQNNPKDYIVVLNTHIPIISKEIFYEVQELLPKTTARKGKKEEYLLEGLLYCGNCGHRISITPRRKKDNKCYTICNYYRTHIRNKLCTTHSNNYEILEKEILDSIMNIYSKSINKDKITKEVINRIKRNDNTIQEINTLCKEINQINEYLDTIYLDKISKKITDDQFTRVKEKLKLDLENKEKKYYKLKQKVENKSNISKNNNLITKYINSFFNDTKITKKLIINLVDKIEIYEDKRVYVKLCFSEKKSYNN